MQRQLTLDLGTPPPSTFDNFHIGANAELVARLRGLDAALAAGPVADRTFYVWGDPGNGRSHLLHALVYEAPPGHARYLGPQSALAAFSFDPRVTIYAVDDCDALSGAQQVALFNLFNEVRAHPTCALVATGASAPMGLAVREDLRTRLGWGLVFHLAPLSDAGKAATLKFAARERGIALADDVPAYLLTHYRRDMPSLMALLDALDRFSLEQKRAVTLPLLRTMLAAGVPAVDGSAEAMDEADAALASGDELSLDFDGELDLLPPPAADTAGDAVPDGNAASDAATTDATTGSTTPGDATPGDSAGTEDARTALAPYEPPRAPAAHAQVLPPVLFTPSTDNVDGELGAKFRDVVHRELGTELKGEVEADVSGEMNGELRGDLDATPPASSASGDATPASTPATAGTDGGQSAQPVQPAEFAVPAESAQPEQPVEAVEPAQSAEPAQSTDPAETPQVTQPAEPAQPSAQGEPEPPASGAETAPTTEAGAPATPDTPHTPDPHADAGTGNGFTRFK